MFTLDNLDKHRRGNLWINELPEIHAAEINTHTAKVKVNSTLQIPPCSVTLELILPLDTSYYALLGATFTPIVGDTLDIIVQVCPDAYDTNRVVQTGIPEYYAAKVLDTAQKFIEINDFSAGKLVFVCSAQDVVGSSPWIFSKVTEIVLSLLVSNPASGSVDELTNQIRSLL